MGGVMRHDLASILILGLTWISPLTGSSAAQEKREAAPAQTAVAGQSNVPAARAMRREAEAQRRQREQEFAKLRALMLAPAAPAALAPVRIRPNAAMVVRRQQAIPELVVIDGGL